MKTLFEETNSWNKRPDGLTSTSVNYQYITSGVKGDLVLNVTIWALYVINAKISPVFARHICHPREYVGPMSHLGASGVPRGKWPTQCASRAKGISYGFRIMKTGPVVFKICPWQICSRWAIYLGPKGPPRGHIPHILKSSSLNLITTFLYIKWKN